MIEIKNLNNSFKKTKMYLLILISLILVSLIIYTLSDDLTIKNKILNLFSSPGDKITIISISKMLYIITFANIYFWDDIKNKYEIIFSREKRSKWIIKKLGYLLLSVIIFEIIIFLIMIILSSKDNIYNALISQQNYIIYDIVLINITYLISLHIKQKYIQIPIILLLIIFIFNIYNTYFFLLIPFLYIIIYISITKTNNLLK